MTVVCIDATSVASLVVVFTELVVSDTGVLLDDVVLSGIARGLVAFVVKSSCVRAGLRASSIRPYISVFELMTPSNAWITKLNWSPALN